jgi:hypothetical protein
LTVELLTVENSPNYRVIDAIRLFEPPFIGCSVSPSEALSRVAPEISAWEISKSYPFSSGISFDGCPIEVSISLSTAGVTAFRFITQPVHHCPIYQSRDQWHRLLEYMSIVLSSPIEKIFELINGCLQKQNVSYFFWFGAEFASGVKPSAKLYINPWAFDGIQPGMLLIEIMSIFGLKGGKSIALAHKLLSEDELGIFMIIGIDVSAQKPETVKIYFVRKFHLFDELPRLLKKMGAFDPFIWRGIFNPDRLSSERQDAEIHSSVSITEPIRLKLNVECHKTFNSDNHCALALRELAEAYRVPANAVECTTAKIASTRRLMGRRWNFIGISPHKLDIYFRPF